VSNVFNLINQAVLGNCIAFINTLPIDGKWMIKILPICNKRSLAQNRMYWKWLKLIADHVTYHDPNNNVCSDDDLHEWFKEKFLETKIIEIRGEIIKKRKSTTKLNTKEMTEYLEKIDQYCAQSMHLILPHPEDMYYQAMQKQPLRRVA
jgi:hypothetical protein